MSAFILLHSIRSSGAASSCMTKMSMPSHKLSGVPLLSRLIVRGLNVGVPEGSELGRNSLPVNCLQFVDRLSSRLP